VELLLDRGADVEAPDDAMSHKQTLQGPGGLCALSDLAWLGRKWCGGYAWQATRHGVGLVAGPRVGHGGAVCGSAWSV